MVAFAGMPAPVMTVPGSNSVGSVGPPVQRSVGKVFTVSAVNAPGGARSSLPTARVSAPGGMPGPEIAMPSVSASAGVGPSTQTTVPEPSVVVPSNVAG